MPALWEAKAGGSQGQESGNISLSERYHIEKEYQGVIGTLLFIGIFLSTICSWNGL